MKQFRRELTDSGLQNQLPAEHPLMVMHRNSLELSHGKKSDAVKNYLVNLSRVLYYVSVWQLEKKLQQSIGQTCYHVQSTHMSNI